jgi:hypothetical protein
MFLGVMLHELVLAGLRFLGVMLLRARRMVDGGLNDHGLCARSIHGECA